MSSKTCKECRYYHPIFEHEGVCTCTSDLHKTCDFRKECAIGGPYPKPPPTNGDKIRQMTNSQLSKFLARISNCSVCSPGNPKGDRKWWYDWTFAPVESESK
jgi:hypothetical protein